MPRHCVGHLVAFQDVLERAHGHAKLLERAQQCQDLVLPVTVAVDPQLLLEHIDQVVEHVESRFKTNYAPIIVVAEGAHPKEGQMELATGDKDAFGHVRLGGIGQRLAEEIETRTGKESRSVVLGPLQRGGAP
jgi:6-phosphofructokinase